MQSDLRARYSVTSHHGVRMSRCACRNEVDRCESTVSCRECGSEYPHLVAITQRLLYGVVWPLESAQGNRANMDTVNRSSVNRSYINTCLSKAIAFRDCGKIDEARNWARLLIIELELAEILEPTSHN